MAEVTIAGGLVVDLATTADLDRHHEAIERLVGDTGPKVVRPQRLASSAASAPGTRPIVIDLGAPPSGLLWRLEYLVLFGDAPFGAAIANVTAAALIGSVPQPGGLALGPPVTGLSIGDVVLPALAVPGVNQAPDKAFVFSTEHLYVVLAGTGLVAGATNYRAVAGVMELTDVKDSYSL